MALTLGWTHWGDSTDRTYVKSGLQRLLDVVADSQPIPTMVQGNPIGEILEAEAERSGFDSVLAWESCQQNVYGTDGLDLYAARYGFIVRAYMTAGYVR